MIMVLASHLCCINHNLNFSICYRKVLYCFFIIFILISKIIIFGSVFQSEREWVTTQLEMMTTSTEDWRAPSTCSSYATSSCSWSVWPTSVSVSGSGKRWEHKRIKFHEHLHFRFDLDFWEWVIEIDWYSYWNAMYVVMVAMILHALNSLMTGYATFTQNRFVLGFSLFLR